MTDFNNSNVILKLIFVHC